MAEIRSFTIDGIESEKEYNITVPIKAGSTLLLTNARVDIDYGSTMPSYGDMYKTINILIGNTVTNFYVVDNNDKLNALKHKLKHNLQLTQITPVGPTNHYINYSDYEPNTAYKIGADMNARINISIRDSNGTPLNVTGPGPQLSFWSFQFQVL